MKVEEARSALIEAHNLRKEEQERVGAEVHNLQKDLERVGADLSEARAGVETGYVRKRGKVDAVIR